MRRVDPKATNERGRQQALDALNRVIDDLLAASARGYASVTVRVGQGLIENVEPATEIHRGNGLFIDKFANEGKSTALNALGQAIDRLLKRHGFGRVVVRASVAPNLVGDIKAIVAESYKIDPIHADAY